MSTDTDPAYLPHENLHPRLHPRRGIDHAALTTADTVVIQHIITDGTIDRAMLAALQVKSCTQQGLIDTVRAPITGERP